MTFQPSPLDAYASTIQLWLDEGFSVARIVSKLKTTFQVETSERSVGRCIARNDLTRLGKNRAEFVEFQGNDKAIVDSGDLSNLGDVESLLSARGLDVTEWDIENVRVGGWEAAAGGGTTELRGSMRVNLKRKTPIDFVYPAQDVEDFSVPDELRSLWFDENYLTVITGDDQEPWGDPGLTECFLQWMEHNRPERGIHLGDLMELPTISKYPDKPEWSATAQECIQAGYEKLKKTRLASPETQWDLLIGNHDERFRNELLLRASALFGVRPADNGFDQLDPFSVRNLLHLDQLGYRYHAPEGGYKWAQVNVSDKLGVRHGWLVGANSARSSLERLGHSIIVGHTHHQRMHFRTTYDINGNPTQLQAVEIGTMCQVKNGLGYAVNPDWQQGFATAQVWPDGSFTIDLAKYENGVLRWRDQSFRA